MKRIVFVLISLVLTTSAFSQQTPDEKELEELRSYLPLLRALVAASIDDPILAFDSRTCPRGWKPYEPAQGRFLRGANDAIGITFGTTTDQDKHSHTTDVEDRRVRKDNDNSDPHVANIGHRHEVSNESHIPPSVNVTFCMLDR